MGEINEDYSHVEMIKKAEEQAVFTAMTMLNVKPSQTSSGKWRVIYDPHPYVDNLVGEGDTAYKAIKNLYDQLF